MKNKILQKLFKFTAQFFVTLFFLYVSYIFRGLFLSTQVIEGNTGDISEAQVSYSKNNTYDSETQMDAHATYETYPFDKDGVALDPSSRSIH